MGNYRSDQIADLTGPRSAEGSLDHYDETADRLLADAERRHRRSNNFNTAVVTFLVATGIFNIVMGVATTEHWYRFSAGVLAFMFAGGLLWARRKLNESMEHVRSSTANLKATTARLRREQDRRIEVLQSETAHDNLGGTFEEA